MPGVPPHPQDWSKDVLNRLACLPPLPASSLPCCLATDHKIIPIGFSKQKEIDTLTIPYLKLIAKNISRNFKGLEIYLAN